MPVPSDPSSVTFTGFSQDEVYLCLGKGEVGQEDCVFNVPEEKEFQAFPSRDPDCMHSHTMDLA